MYDDFTGFPMHMVHTLFLVVLHAVVSHDPGLHVAHFLHSAIEVLCISVEKVPAIHGLAALDPLVQYVPTSHGMGGSAGIGHLKPL
jgi:hypothetical protein